MTVIFGIYLRYYKYNMKKKIRLNQNSYPDLDQIPLLKFQNPIGWIDR